MYRVWASTIRTIARCWRRRSLAIAVQLRSVPFSHSVITIRSNRSGFRAITPPPFLDHQLLILEKVVVSSSCITDPPSSRNNEQLRGRAPRYGRLCSIRGHCEAVSRHDRHIHHQSHCQKSTSTHPAQSCRGAVRSLARMLNSLDEPRIRMDRIYIYSRSCILPSCMPLRVPGMRSTQR